MVDRIVITGMSVNTGLGDTLDGFLDGLYCGRSAIRRWSAFDTDRVYSKIGGDLSGYDVAAKVAGLEGALPAATFRRIRKLVARGPWTTKLSLLLAASGWIDAGLAHEEIDLEDVALVVAGHNLNALYQSKTRETFEDEPDFIDGMTSLYTLDSDHAGAISEGLQIRGPIFTVGGACASGNLALRAAMHELRCGGASRALVVGSVLEFAPVDVHAMALMGAISHASFNDAPEHASRPYDRRREGFLPAHGGATLVIERLESAVRRGARIHAEVLACAAASDGNRQPQPSEDGQSRAMTRALRDARLRPEDIDFVSAHATSTPVGDITELRSIKRVFGEHAKKLRINAPKSMLGHTCWASALVETVAAVLQMNAGVLHRSMNVDDLDPEVDLDVCHEGNVPMRVRRLMKNSFGFGGIDCVSILGRYEG